MFDLILIFILIVISLLFLLSTELFCDNMIHQTKQKKDDISETKRHCSADY